MTDTPVNPNDPLTPGPIHPPVNVGVKTSNGLNADMQAAIHVIVEPLASEVHDLTAAVEAVGAHPGVSTVRTAVLDVLAVLSLILAAVGGVVALLPPSAGQQRVVGLILAVAGTATVWVHRLTTVVREVPS